MSWVATAVAAWGIYAVGARVSGERAGVVLAVLWAALPIGIVTSMAYSEALFTALAAWAVHATLSRRWLLAGVLAAAAGLTRPVGVAVVAAVVVTAAVQSFRDRDLRPLPGLVLAPLGWVGYVAWVGQRTGDPLGYFRVADGWGNGFDGGRAFTVWTWHHLGDGRWPLGVLLVAAVVVLVGLLVLAVRDRQPLPLLVLAGVLLALALDHVRLLRLQAALPSAGLPAAAPGGRAALAARHEDDRRLPRRADGRLGGVRRPVAAGTRPALTVAD